MRRTRGYEKKEKRGRKFHLRKSTLVPSKKKKKLKRSQKKRNWGPHKEPPHEKKRKPSHQRPTGYNPQHKKDQMGRKGITKTNPKPFQKKKMAKRLV